MSLQFITSLQSITAETEKLNNEQYGACGSGTVWDLVLRSVLPGSLADDVCKDDDMHQNKAAVAAVAGSPVAIETTTALLYAVVVPDDAPVVPVPSVPAEAAVKMKTTDSAPVQAEAEELTSGEESASSTRMPAPRSPRSPPRSPARRPRRGMTHPSHVRTSNACWLRAHTISVECRGATPTGLRCTASPRSPRSITCPLTRGFAATRCPLPVVGVFHWEE